MNITFADAILPSWDRYKTLFARKDHPSIARSLQYESIKGRPLKGKLLDFGGGSKAKYLPLLKYESYESVNIDPAMEPSLLTKVGEKIPSADNEYDTILSLNTLEHIFDARSVLADIFRVLKPGGEFVCAVPFLYPVHAHPDDFCRYTASWWSTALAEAGFVSAKITPHVWGPFSTGITCSGAPGPLRKLRVQAALLLDLLYAKLRFGNNAYFTGPAGKTLQNHALSYFIEARK